MFIVDQIYNSYFFTDFYEKNGGGNYEEKEQWMPFFYGIADEIIKRYNPKTVLDAGCAMGYLVEALRDRGVEAYGIDISEYAIHAVRKDIRPFCAVNSITESIPYTFPQKFDLIITIEVLEHLFPEDSAIAIANLCQYTDMIIFSSTPSDIEDRTHVNVQQREYWARIFAKNNFYRELSQPMEFISPWAMVFVKKHDIEKIIFDYEMHLRINELEKKKLATEENNKARENGEVFENQLQIFYDYGNGFSEENSIKIPYEGLNFSTSVAIPEKVVAVRIDPAEGIFCAVIDFKAETECENCCVQTKDAEQIDNTYIFYTKDPQFIIERQNVKFDNLVIRGTVLNFEEKEEEKILLQVLRDANLHGIQKLKEKEVEIKNLLEEYAMLQEEKDKKIHDLLEQVEQWTTRYQTTVDTQEKLITQLEHYTTHYHAAVNQREELKAQLAQVQIQYNVISNATCWKMTAPLRWILDRTKQMLKKNRYTYLFCKGLKCLKQNGVVYTWNKVKGWRKYRLNFQNALQPLYLEADLEAQKHYNFSKNIKFSILVPLYNTPEQFLREMVESVQAQTYGNWELCMADGSDDEHSNIEKICRNYVKKDRRIKYRKLNENRGISNNTNACIEMAIGEYIALLDHDDLLAPNALFENAIAIEETNADVLYSDEDHLTIGGKHVNPFYKPDWSPDLLYSQMYICHFLVVKKTIFENLGGFRSEYNGSQDYDLVLRLSEQTNRICHIPLILYTWRESENSTANNADAKPYAHIAGKKALEEHLKRKYGSNAYVEDGEYTFTYDAHFLAIEKPLVSIIIPMKDKWELTNNCIHSILEKSNYQNFEIIILNNRSEEMKTIHWLNEVTTFDKRIRVFDADMEFNWSKLNNFGIEKALGEVYIFLNNDTLVISPDWIERLAENALRDDIGVVGAMLLYEDETIQHAGVVVGIGGWADHIFKGMLPIHYGSPFVSPVLSRNVLAVTGACMAISKSTIQKIGGFNESFVICGSDIEMCIRAYDYGLFNRYDANVKLYHLESKSRDSYIPKIDFEKSYECYTPYRENVDPFFNINLDTNSVVPKERGISVNRINFKNFLKKCPLAVSTCKKVKDIIEDTQSYDIPEIGPVYARKGIPFNSSYRLNLLIPSVDQKHIFGGISTALKFFEELRKKCNCDARIITLDASIDLKTTTVSEEYCLIESDNDSMEHLQLIEFSDRHEKTIPVCENDIFMATGWWTAYVIKPVIEWQSDIYDIVANPLIYFIQDFEPGFYPWSSRYLLADSTYRMDIPVFAIMNSAILKEYFDEKKYSFSKTWCFDPVLNDKLKDILLNSSKSITKKKQILIYGRPSVDRNAFSLIIIALKIWREKQANSSEWIIYSAGETHGDIDLGGGIYLKSVGKLSLEEYAQLMLETYAGISLMVSPHPSYPPLEMATFGIKTITNHYESKDLSKFSKNIISLSSCAPSNLAETLCELCNEYSEFCQLETDIDYVTKNNQFENIIKEINVELNSLVKKS